MLESDVNESNVMNDICSTNGSYNYSLRVLVYVLLNGNAPIKNQSTILSSILMWLNIKCDKVPCMSTVNNMLREVSVLSSLFTVKFMLDRSVLRIGFDATTQEGVHVNCLYIGDKYDIRIIDMRELPGGAASDYVKHITDCIDQISNIYVSIETTN